ncbi:MAG: S8 family serine peptidase [Phycisphaerae bacterium]|jgi:subtilisin family serine protease|nr:S8 family serine peptidase [Phycisphaerae bacterium]
MERTKFNDSSRRAAFERLEPRLLLSAVTDLVAPVSVQWQGSTAQARPDEWIIRLQDGLGGGDETNWLESSLADSGIGAESLESIGQSQFSLLKAPELIPEKLAAWADKHARVLYTEPNFVYTISETIASTTPDDPAMADGSLWGLHNTGQSGGTLDADIDAPEAWDLTTGSADVVLAVIDTGVDYTHPDLADNMWINPGEIADDGIDNDSNGYIDDIYGWDFVNNDNDPMDGHDHGTHVSGTIGGVGDNSSGVSGVNWDVSIMALKFLDDSGSGSTADAISAIDYATMMRRDHGINVVATNNSWGGGSYSSALRDAIEIAGREGILFIAAASNEGLDNDVFATYPSNYNSEYILAVAATDRDDRLANFSNYGAITVDLGAPGVSIYSSIPGDAYDWFNGTSMATPHVTGVAGLLAASEPGVTAGEIKDAILAGVDPIAALAGRTVTGGRLNAFNSLLALGTFGPRVMSVSPSGASPPVDTIGINFSEDIVVASVVGANFLLRDNGADNVFDTADDTVFAIGDSDLDQAQGDRVVISLGSDLPFEAYRMTIAGTGPNPVRDSEDNALNEGRDHEHFFTIVSPYGPLEPNDTLAEATVSGLTSLGTVAFEGEIGDGYQGDYDVDLFEFQTDGVMILVADTDADILGSSLDTILRLFDSEGAQLAVNDDWDFQDSHIEYDLDTAGTYYIGVSGYSNFDYDPLVAGSGSADSTGEYSLTLSLLRRPEIHGSKWDDSNGDGVRDEGESPLPGWTIFLDSDVNGVLDAGEASTTTDTEGNFSFVDLSPGTYVVGEIAQDGWERTYPLSVGAESYVGYSTALSFEDISDSGQGVLVDADDESHLLSPAVLGGFEFPMYGATYDQVYINSNGLLTFDQSATAWLNGDLSMYPIGAAVSVFWDDLVISGMQNTAVYWEVRGSGADERLIVQWHEVEFYNGEDPGTITFQAVLGTDGHITFSYSDLESTDIGAEGARATVGIKDTWFFGYRILLSYNSGPGQFVETGKSVHLVKPLVGQHAVAVDPGEIETAVLFGSGRTELFGDANGDGTVDEEDIGLFMDQFGVRGASLSADFNGSGNVDLADFAILRINLGNSLMTPPAAPAPPPGAVSLAFSSDNIPERAVVLAPGEASPASFDTTDLLARAIPLDVTSGGLSTAGDRIDIPAVRTVRYLYDGGNSGSEGDMTDKFFGAGDLLDSVLADVLGVPLA